MPIQYPTGTLAEHRACRSDAAVFDVSHLGTVRVTGPGAFDRLQAALTNDLGKVAPGRAQYTHLLDEADASVLDDIIVWWVIDDRFDVMPNASNTERVLAALGGDDVTAGRADHRRPGPGGQGAAGDRGAGGRGGRAVPGGRDRRARAAQRGGRHRLHGGGRGRAGRRRRPRRGGMGRGRATPASRRRGSGLGTRCGSRPGCRSTVTSWGPASRPCRPVSAGWCRGTRASSGVERRWPSSASGVSNAGCKASRSRGAAHRGRTRP